MEAVEVVRRYCDAWLRRDVAALVGAYHHEIVLHWYGDNPLAGAHRGKPAALQALARLQQRCARRLVRVRDLAAGADHVVVWTREAFARDGAEVELDRTLVFRVRDDRISECRAFDDDPRALDLLLRGA